MSENKIIVGMREAVDNARLREKNSRLTAEVARLRGALQMIVDERGRCSSCLKIAEGEGTGFVTCEDRMCNWEPQNPVDVARAALESPDDQG